MSFFKDIPRVIALLAEQLREPSFPGDEFEKLRTQWLGELASAKQLPAQAEIAFRRAIFPAGHPDYKLTPEETIAA